MSANLLGGAVDGGVDFQPIRAFFASAQGIAQFTPGTAAAYEALDDPFDAPAAINAQAHLMSDLLHEFGSVALALAAYNAGPGAVAACDCVPPYPGDAGLRRPDPRATRRGRGGLRPGNLHHGQAGQVDRLVQQAGDTARKATRNADDAIQANPSGTMAGKRSQAVIITETDAPASAGNAIRTATNPGRGRKIPASATTPEHVRGLPGRTGMLGKGLGVVGFGLSAFALWGDYQQGDWEMGIGDAFGAVGGGLELYAIAVPGATVATVSAMTAGLVIGGIGLAASSYVSMNRAAEVGDTPGVVAGGVGIGAGLAIAGGAIGIAAGSVVIAPVVLVVGIVAAVGVGIFHAGRYFDWW